MKTHPSRYILSTCRLTSAVLSAVAAVVCVLLTACGNDGKRYVIGVSQCSEDIWRDKLNNELRDAMYVYDNVDVRIASADDVDSMQAEQINRFIDDGVDMLIVAPNQVNSVTRPIARAYDKGIPVIYFDRTAGADKYTAFIGADNEKIGYTIGVYVAAQLKGRGTVAEIRGLEGSSPAIERSRGFEAALKEHPGIRLVAAENGNWLQESGRRAAAKMFAEGVRPDYVFAHNDRMALGAWQAARQIGLGNTIKFVGIDALPGKDGGIRLVRDGVLDASYIYPTRGDLVIHLALNILEGKPYRRDNYMKAALVTRDNAETMLMQAEEINHMSGQLEELHGRVDMFFTQYSHQKVYFILSLVILVLVVVLFAAVYRAALVRRRMEREAADAKLSFFTDLSHDLRTPLTLIVDPVERILDEGDVSQKQRSMLMTVKRNAALLLKMTGEILDLRKIQDGKMTLDVTEFCLSDCLKAWIDGFRPLAAKHEVGINLDMEEGLTVRADYNKVERICYNLVSNALKYNRPGGSITVRAAVSGTDVVITVADTGIGMSEENQKRIFDKFFRIGSGGGGTGVGLAVVKAFAELHGGCVSVKSVEGEGSEFSVVLPSAAAGGQTAPAEAADDAHGGSRQDRPQAADFLAEDYPAEPQGTAAASSAVADGCEAGCGQDPDGTASSRPLILVVDDNIEVRQYVLSLLGGEYDVCQASDGKEGLAIALKDVPDLIICDVLMPVMDGLEMCRRVKLATATSHVPVILLTSQALANQRAEGYDCGADAYITKPFSSKVLMSRVRNLLENRKRLKYIYGSAGEQPVADGGDTDSRFMADFSRIVGEHLADSALTVETVSAELGLSRVQMYRKVKQLTGQSPVELIRMTRLKRAEHLLKTTDKTVSEISYEVGFSSPSYFSKCFRDQFGCAPGDVRQ